MANFWDLRQIAWCAWWVISWCTREFICAVHKSPTCISRPLKVNIAESTRISARAEGFAAYLCVVWLRIIFSLLCKVLPLWVWRLCKLSSSTSRICRWTTMFYPRNPKNVWFTKALFYRTLGSGGVLGASKRALETFPRAFVEKCLQITCSGLARLRADRGRTLTCKATTETELYIRMGVNIQVNARAQKTGALNGSTFDSILSFFAFRSILNIQAPVSAGCLIFKRC